MVRRKFLQTRNAVLGIQKYGRSLLARRKFKATLDNYKAIQIQRFCRGYLARMAYKSKLRKIIICQSAVRRFLAKRLYKKMKAEARTISHMQKMYKGLENKIISMQQRIDELNKENVQLKTKNQEIPELKSKLDMMKNMEHELKAVRVESMNKDEVIVSIRQQLENERDEKMNILEDKAVAEQEWNDQKQAWRVENEELKRQVHEMIELAKKEENGKWCCWTRKQIGEQETNRSIQFQLHHIGVAFYRKSITMKFIKPTNMPSKTKRVWKVTITFYGTKSIVCYAWCQKVM